MWKMFVLIKDVKQVEEKYCRNRKIRCKSIVLCMYVYMLYTSLVIFHITTHMQSL